MEPKWNDDEWNLKIAPVLPWLEEARNNDKYEDEVAIVDMMLGRAERQPLKREPVWTALLAEFRFIEDSPIGGGKRSSLPEKVQADLATIRAGLIEGYTAAFNPTVALCEFRRTRGENATRTYHTDAAAFAESKANGKIAMLKKMFADDEWNGSIPGLELLSMEADSDD